MLTHCGYSGTANRRDYQGSAPHNVMHPSTCGILAQESLAGALHYVTVTTMRQRGGVLG